MITELHSADDYAKEIANHKGFALIDFWATWCPPCRMLAPVMEKAEQEFGQKINFTKADSDEVRDMAASFDIMSIPTIVIFKDGKEIGRLSGYRPLNQLTEELNQVLADRK